MSYGYSIRLIELNKKANKRSLGVRLGKLCIKHDLPIAQVSIHLGVSRQTLYNWFEGVCEPHHTVSDKVEEYLDSFKPNK